MKHVYENNELWKWEIFTMPQTYTSQKKMISDQDGDCNTVVIRELIFSCFEGGSCAIIVPGWMVHPFQSIVLSNSNFFHETFEAQQPAGINAPPKAVRCPITSTAMVYCDVLLVVKWGDAYRNSC